MMKEFIEEKLTIMQQEYKKNPIRIYSDYNKEREALQSYHGRELLELLQNADDELRDDMKKEIYVSFRNDTLTIANYGDPFDEDGIISLMYSNASEKKYRKKLVIGNKGTGFRAILGWAKEISIDSSELHVRFSQEHSQSVLKSLFLDDVEKIKEMKAATLVFPEWIDKQSESEYTTVISIRIKEDVSVREDIRKQIQTLNEDLLLFMNRTQSLVIELDAHVIRYVKTEIDKHKVNLQKYINDEMVYSKDWLLNREEGMVVSDNEKKNYSLIIAYDCEGKEPENQVIYSYFPTDVRFPFPVLLHANFELNADRNHLIKGSVANKEILEKAACLLIDTAIKANSGKISYDIIKFLIKQEKLQPELVSYDFEQVLVEKIKKSSIFPTVNKKYVSFSKELIFYSTPLAKYLSGGGFENLLMYVEDETVQDFVQNLGTDIWYVDDAVEYINAWVKRHKATEEHIRHVAYTAVAFIDEYGEYSSTKPYFFYNQDGKLIETDRPIFYLTESTEITKPPQFVEVDFMLPYMRNYICKKLKKDYELKADVLDRLRCYKVKEYNADELLNYLRRIFEEDKKNLKKAQINKRWEKMIVWLWKNRKTIFSEDRTTAFYVKTRKNEFVLSTDTYAGIEYQNDFGEKLLGKALPDRMICDLKKYLESGAEDTEIKDFLRHLGVAYMPTVKEKEDRAWHLRGNAVMRDYIEKVYSVLTFPYKTEGDVFQSVSDMISRTSHIVIRHDYIEGLEEILSICETADILEWIQKDDDVRRVLTTHKTIYASSVQWTWDSKQNDRVISEIKKPYSYILHTFQSIPWIQVGQERYKISDCILSMEKIENLAPALVEPELSEYLKNIDGPKGKLRTEYTDLLKDMGVKRDFSDLPLDKIYEVLCLLPERENTEDLAKRFYVSLIKSRREFSQTELRSKKRQEFLEKGKILCDGGYKSVSASYYLDGKDVCNKIAESFNLVCLPKRLNSKRIEKILGIKKLVLKGDIMGVPKIHNENAYFEKDFRKFLSLAFVYRVDAKEDIKKEARRFATIEISLCSEIEVEYNNIKAFLDDYEYILKGAHTYYLKVPAELTAAKMRHNIQLSSAIASIISSYLDVGEVMQKMRELYNAGTNKDREFLICQEFEDTSIIAQAKQALNMDEDFRDEFIEIISRLSGAEYDDFEYLIRDIDFENFSEISNARPFINLFKTLNIDIADYNGEAPAVDIDLRPYFDGEIKDLLPLYEDKYKWTHYYRLKDKGLSEKKMLVDNFLAFEETKIITHNSVEFDCNKEIISQLRIQENITGINLVNKYNREKNKLKGRIENPVYFDAFLQMTENMSLLYYGEIGELIRLYNLYVEKMIADSIENSVDLPQQRLSTVWKPDTQPIITEKPLNSKSGKTGNRKTGFPIYKSRNEQERIGLLGERLVYNMLLEDSSLQKVRWVSENAKKDNVNPEGSAGKGYDIEYIDADGKRRYIEVKTSKAPASEGIRFFYSDNEYRFASEHVVDYFVYYVSDVTSIEPKVLILDNVFIGDDFNKEKYNIEVSSQYVIMAELK
ncbi:MAG: DUF3883 domain-containing protein [Lachnospiraceae bacterium]|nr:DUF3883 domain-containing protein [Lachnospiraceae bacterium]